MSFGCPVWQFAKFFFIVLTIWSAEFPTFLTSYLSITPTNMHTLLRVFSDCFIFYVVDSVLDKIATHWVLALKKTITICYMHFKRKKTYTTQCQIIDIIWMWIFLMQRQIRLSAFRKLIFHLSKIERKKTIHLMNKMLLLRD